MRVTNDDGLEADLPDGLAKLLIESRGWHKGEDKSRSAAPPRVALEPVAVDDDPMPMTHLPGVVDGISMNRLKKLVADGAIPHVPDGRTKLVKPSDVRAYMAATKS